jgi:two-component system sensor histidine kinase YesM
MLNFLGNIFKINLLRSISIKLFLVFFISSIFIVSTMAFITYKQTTEMVSNTQEELMETLLSTTDDTLSFFQQQFNIILLSAASQPRLPIMKEGEVEDLLESLVLSQSIIEKMYFIKNDEFVAGTPKPYVRAIGPGMISKLREEIEGDLLGIQCTEPYLSMMSHWTVSVALPVVTPRGEDLGIMVIDIPLRNITQALPSTGLHLPSAIIIFSPSMKPIAIESTTSMVDYSLNENTFTYEDLIRKTTLESLKSGPIAIEIGDIPVLLLAKKPINQYGWIPVFIYSRDKIVDERVRVARAGLQSTLILIFFAGILTFLGSKIFSRPIILLSQMMTEIDFDDFHEISFPKRNDEIGQLSNSFQEMLTRMHIMFEELKITQDKKRESDIRAIQAQIRPHFLFNTLTAIGHSASLGKTKEVYELIRALTEILSYSIEKVSDKVPLALEINFLRNYSGLLKLITGIDITVKYQIAPSVGNILIPKLLLQPLVENAIFHGFSKKKSGELIIMARKIIKESQLEITIIDNGVGIDPLVTAEIEEYSTGSTGGHIGLKSVKARLYFHYHEDAKLSILPNPDFSGTKINILLPAEYGEANA